MRCLVIHAHPDPDSFNTAVRERAVAALSSAGHEVEVIDLYRLGYDPCLGAQEHVDYDSIGLDHPDPMVAGHIEQLGRAEMLVFVYPTWWSGLPAILKGWLDRTLLPEVAFSLDPGDDGKAVVRPKLDNIKRLVGVTSYGSGPLEVRLLGDAGRRTITRTVRLVCAKRCRSTWLGLHRLDTADPAQRAEFLDRVSEKLGAIR